MDEESDFEKLRLALGTLAKFASVDDALEMLGLRDLPVAQRYGILGGCIVFTLTISSIFCLLVFGGSFTRMAQQAETGENTIPKAVELRKGRPLLLERLLEASERMMGNYPSESVTEEMTILTKSLLNISPNIEKAKAMTALIETMEKKLENGKSSPELEEKREELRKLLPDGYEEIYIEAYQRCQDKPGGPMLGGKPEARYEAYARAFAGCGTFTSQSYRRSYGRMYEATSCATHKAQEKFNDHWFERPGDIVGRTVRLEPLEVNRHLQEFYNITCGEAYLDGKAYDPDDVWAFREAGPFKDLDELRSSSIFQLKQNEAAFAIISNVTDRMCGIITLKNDDPKNLNISLEVPIVKWASEGTIEQIEAPFLLIDRLFGMGYRRIQYSVDSMDTDAKQLARRMGFTQEGLIPKHMIVKESSRDSIFYGMLNNDWEKGARAAYFKKIHGAAAQKADAAREKREGQYDEQNKKLKLMKLAEKEKNEKKNE